MNMSRILLRVIAFSFLLPYMSESALTSAPEENFNESKRGTQQSADDVTKSETVAQKTAQFVKGEQVSKWEENTTVKKWLERNLPGVKFMLESKDFDSKMKDILNARSLYQFVGALLFYTECQPDSKLEPLRLLDMCLNKLMYSLILSDQKKEVGDFDWVYRTKEGWAYNCWKDGVMYSSREPFCTKKHLTAKINGARLFHNCIVPIQIKLVGILREHAEGEVCETLQKSTLCAYERLTDWLTACLDGAVRCKTLPELEFMNATFQELSAHAGLKDRIEDELTTHHEYNARYHSWTQERFHSFEELHVELKRRLATVQAVTTIQKEINGILGQQLFTKPFRWGDALNHFECSHRLRLSDDVPQPKWLGNSTIFNPQQDLKDSFRAFLEKDHTLETIPRISKAIEYLAKLPTSEYWPTKWGEQLKSLVPSILAILDTAKQSVIPIQRQMRSLQDPHNRDSFNQTKGGASQDPHVVLTRLRNTLYNAIQPQQGQPSIESLEEMERVLKQLDAPNVKSTITYFLRTADQDTKAALGRSFEEAMSKIAEKLKSLRSLEKPVTVHATSTTTAASLRAPVASSVPNLMTVHATGTTTAPSTPAPVKPAIPAPTGVAARRALFENGTTSTTTTASSTPVSTLKVAAPTGPSVKPKAPGVVNQPPLTASSSTSSTAPSKPTPASSVPARASSAATTPASRTSTSTTSVTSAVPEASKPPSVKDTVQRINTTGKPQ